MKANENIARFITILDNLSKAGHDIPGLIMSKPGFGKTSTIEMWAKYKDYNLTTLIPSRYSSDDVLGLQTLVDGKLMRLSPAWYNSMVQKSQNGKRNILFIDELSTCDTYIQGPLFDLIFSHSLGEYKLPENSIILSAGNYSCDLNNDFKMTSPLVNRFMILNLSVDDYDIFEVLDEKFDDVKTKDEVEEYLKLNTEAPAYSYGAFKNWLKSSGEVNFGTAEYQENEEVGLLGFTSIRSMTYSLKFAQEYVANYSDDLWMQITGDTLGTAAKSEGKLMRDILTCYKTKFESKALTEGRSLREVCTSILEANAVSPENLKALDLLIKSLSSEDISSAEMSKLSKIFVNFKDVPGITSIHRQLLNKMY